LPQPLGENGHWGEREAHAVVPVGKEDQGEREQRLRGGKGKEWKEREGLNLAAEKEGMDDKGRRRDMI
jgi:hypothetical protein